MLFIRICRSRRLRGNGRFRHPAPSRISSPANSSILITPPDYNPRSPSSSHPPFVQPPRQAEAGGARPAGSREGPQRNLNLGIPVPRFSSDTTEKVKIKDRPQVEIPAYGAWQPASAAEAARAAKALGLSGGGWRATARAPGPAGLTAGSAPPALAAPGRAPGRARSVDRPARTRRSPSNSRAWETCCHR